MILPIIFPRLIFVIALKYPFLTFTNLVPRKIWQWLSLSQTFHLIPLENVRRGKRNSNLSTWFKWRWSVKQGNCTNLAPGGYINAIIMWISLFLPQGVLWLIVVRVSDHFNVSWQMPAQVSSPALRLVRVTVLGVPWVKPCAPHYWSCFTKVVLSCSRVTPIP